MKETKSAAIIRPAGRGTAAAYLLSALIALLMSAASAAGLLFRHVLYPSEEFIRAFVPNDAANLLVGVPALTAVLLFSRRKDTKAGALALLFWPGALLFVLYNYCVYLLALPFGAGFPAHLLLMVLSVYALILLAPGIDTEKARSMLEGAPFGRTAGAVLAVFGLIFLLRLGFVLAGALAAGETMARSELALHAADALITPAWAAAGVLLWRRKPTGYAAAPGLLFHACLLFAALFLFLLLRPALTGAPPAPADAAVILVMGLICFIPFILFVRGARPVGPASSPEKRKTYRKGDTA